MNDDLGVLGLRLDSYCMTRLLSVSSSEVPLFAPTSPQCYPCQINGDEDVLVFVASVGVEDKKQLFLQNKSNFFCLNNEGL